MRPLLWSFEGARASDSAAARLTTWAVIATGKHLFPFRTEKLSPLAPMVLGEQSPGRVGRRPFLRVRPREGPHVVQRKRTTSATSIERSRQEPAPVTVPRAPA